MKKLKLNDFLRNDDVVLGRKELKEVVGGAALSSCYTCTENGQVVWNYGSCSTTTTCCASGTCRDYAC